MYKLRVRLVMFFNFVFKIENKKQFFYFYFFKIRVVERCFKKVFLKQKPCLDERICIVFKGNVLLLVYKNFINLIYNNMKSNSS